MNDITDRTFKFSLRILKLFRQVNQAYEPDKNILTKQRLRSATSIGANVEEAQSDQSRADFISKMAIALKEARETNYWSRLLSASGLVRSDEVVLLIQESEELKKILGPIIVSAKK